jgi:hypothetical protein
MRRLSYSPSRKKTPLLESFGPRSEDGVVKAEILVRASFRSFHQGVDRLNLAGGQSEAQVTC